MSRYVPTYPPLPLRQPSIEQGLLFYVLACDPFLPPPPLTNECPYLASPDVLDSLEQANYIHEIKGHNPANCIPIALSTNKPKGSVTEYVPSFLLSSVMSLSPKIDEVREVIRYGNYEFVSLVETWLQSHIHDNVINIQGYNLIHRDRVEGTHGGVCVYIKDSIAFTVLDELYNSSFEILWINIRPNRLPRLPSADNSDILDYPSNCLSLLESRFPNCGLIIPTVALLSLVISIS